MIARKIPLKRSVKPAKARKRIAARRAKPRRVSVLRDRGYLDELRMGYCEIGMLHGSEKCSMVMDAAHGPVNGIGSKGADSEAVSLCRTHHREQHAVGWSVFERKYGFNRGGAAAISYALYRQGPPAGGTPQAGEKP